LHGYAACVSHARRVTQPAVPALILMHGLSGSGKTYASQGLLEGLGARSDVERKRLHDLHPLQASGSRLGEGLYGEAATRATYERLASLAAISLGAGYTTIVDAAFLRRWQRDRFRGMATVRGVPFLIAHCHAEEPEIEYRLVERARQDASEATVAVMQWQRLSAEPLADDEIDNVVALNIQHNAREQMRICVAEALARRGRS
jgi:predicted kinase